MTGWFTYVYLILWIELAASAYVKGYGYHGPAREDRGTYVHVDSHMNFDCSEGEFRVKHGTQCKQFERCSNGRHEVFDCPSNTLWNQDNSACDEYHHVDIHTCTTNFHLPTVGSGSGHLPTTTKSSHVAHHSYVHCGDGRCYHGSCSDTHSHCHNNVCSTDYKCHCKNGYEGHSCELQKVSENHCRDNTLLCGNGDCVMNITDSTYSCYCHSYYTGRECDLLIVSGYYCNNHCQHGDCVTGSWTTSHFCHCYDGYTGTHCDRHAASVSHVSAGPTTQPSTSTTHSTTHPAPHGTHCGHDMCYHGKCSNVRYCYSNGNCYYNHECSCYSNYEGDSCSLMRVAESHCRTTQDYCHGHCVYDIVDSKYTCRCSSGYTGEFCELRKVQDYHCQYHGYPCNHGYCVHKSGYDPYYFCHCSHGYTGQKCDARAVSNTTTTVTPLTPTASPPTTATQITPDPITVHQTSPTFAPTTKSTTVPTAKSTSAPTTSSTPAPTTSSTTATTTTTAAATATGTKVLTSSTSIPSTSVPSSVPSTSVPSTTADATATGSTQASIMSTTAAPPTTTTPKINYHTCNKLQTVMDIGNKAAINNTNTTSCPSGSFATPDAFVLGHCDTHMPSTWTKGTSVSNECQNIPLYTPVATFVSATYNSMGGLSGIFLGCLPTGFKLGAQPCDGVPTILHVESGGMLTMNPRLYYTVQ